MINKPNQILTMLVLLISKSINIDKKNPNKLPTKDDVNENIDVTVLRVSDVISLFKSICTGAFLRPTKTKIGSKDNIYIYVIC